MYYNIDNSFQLIYSSDKMQEYNMDTEDILYTDFSLNYDIIEENPNDTMEEIFHYEIEKAIDTGNINIIKNAIIVYGHLINKSYIDWANSIAFQIIEEKMEDISL
tara:strand:+ start:156 stop:470 length:315 start_codon:yes stop_codon:yes gene_type:complete